MPVTGSRARAVRTLAVLGLCTTLGAQVPSGPATAGPPTPAGTAEAWTLDLAGPATDLVNVRRAGPLSIMDVRQATTGAEVTGTVLTAPHRTSTAVSDVRAEVTATVPAGSAVHVEVRAQRAGGSWTEWREAAPEAALLPAPATTIQARVTLTAAPDGASPGLTSVRLAGSVHRAPTGLATPQAAAAAGPRTYRVFATREGLVGRTTANGHVIRERDHFVALPSRRALSPRGSTTYSVRVCNPANNRCETAPVWDVGPWNTKDDYWNPSSQRQMWRDLPQGKPQAQAANQDNYNNGRDESGRDVPNPAGIDLADGTFWDGLRMTNNGWVDVTFLWTGDDPGAGTWPVLRQGGSGEDVRTVQHLLNQHGANVAADGQFGSGTTTAVRSFQSAKGLSADGVVGPQTWAALIVTVRPGARNHAVRAVQGQLTANGYPTTVDGEFGSGTEATVKRFQTANGLTADGVVGPMTWQALVG
jgi:hypothetical protein